jgi:hypothetical protein
MNTNRHARRAAQVFHRTATKQPFAPLELQPDAQRRAAAYPACRAIVAFWQNNRISVQHYRVQSAWGEIEHLIVRRNDEEPIHDWHVLYRVVREIFPGRTAIEVYPPDEELIDQANIYHLWVLPEGFRVPFGIAEGVPFGTNPVELA